MAIETESSAENLHMPTKNITSENQVKLITSKRKFAGTKLNRICFCRNSFLRGLQWKLVSADGTGDKAVRPSWSPQKGPEAFFVCLFSFDKSTRGSTQPPLPCAINLCTPSVPSLVWKSQMQPHDLFSIHTVQAGCKSKLFWLILIC